MTPTVELDAGAFTASTVHLAFAVTAIRTAPAATMAVVSHFILSRTELCENQNQNNRRFKKIVNYELNNINEL